MFVVSQCTRLPLFNPPCLLYPNPENTRLYRQCLHRWLCSFLMHSQLLNLRSPPAALFAAVLAHFSFAAPARGWGCSRSGREQRRERQKAAIARCDADSI